MKKLSNGRKVMIFTVLLMTAFMLSNYDKSGAKYYKTEKDSITYNLGFDALTKENLGKFRLLYDRSEYSRAYFSFTVPRNTIMTSLDNEDKYRIVVNSGCEIKKINGTTINNGTNMISYTYSNNDVDNITVEYSCPVDKLLITNSTESFDTDVTIYEQMTTDYKEFIYLKKQESDIYKVSIDLPAEIIGDYHVLSILENDDISTMDAKISDWLLANISKYKETNENTYKNLLDYVAKESLLNYLKKAYTTSIKDFDQSLIRGITFNHVGDTYTYTMSEDFLAYAVSDGRYGSNAVYDAFWFADVNKPDSELQVIFEYYVDKYLYNKTTTDYTTLMNYINTNGGIASVLKGTGSITGINYATGRLRLRKDILTNAAQISSVANNTITNSVNSVNKVPSIVETINSSEKTEVDNIIVNKILNDYSELISNDAIKEFIKVDRDLIITPKEGFKLNDYIIYSIDGEYLLINIYTDEKDEIQVVISNFDENIEINIETVTKISLATNILEDKVSVVNSLNELINIIDTKYEKSYADIITVDMINDASIKGLYIYENENIIKIYLKNDIDDFGIGTLVKNEEISSDENNGAPDVTITDDPEDVTVGDTPDKSPIFDDLVTTEPSYEVVDPVVGDNETETENPENQEEEEQEEEKVEEVDDNSKKAETDIEKEFVSDIEEVEKLIEDMKDFVGDAEKISEEDEAIAEVDELIETVKDYINKA